MVPRNSGFSPEANANAPWTVLWRVPAELSAEIRRGACGQFGVGQGIGSRYCCRRRVVNKVAEQWGRLVQWQEGQGDGATQDFMQEFLGRIQG